MIISYEHLAVAPVLKSPKTFLLVPDDFQNILEKALAPEQCSTVVFCIHPLLKELRLN